MCLPKVCFGFFFWHGGRNVVFLDMAWRINKHGGIYKEGAVFPLQKRYQIAVSFLDWQLWFCCSGKHLYLRRCVKHRWQVHKDWPFCPWGKRFTSNDNGAMESGLPGSTCYDPFMYLSEIQKALRDDLNLAAAKIPSIPTICRTLISWDLTRHKAAKVSLERFTAENRARRTAFVEWRRTVDPRKLYFVDATAIQLVNGVQTTGRCHTKMEMFP